MTGVDTFMVGQGRASRIAYFVVRAVVVGFTRLWTRLSIEGREHIPDDGPFVLAPVHRSNMDTPIGGVSHPASAAVHGQGLVVEEAAGGVVLLVAGWVPGVARHGRP